MDGYESFILSNLFYYEYIIRERALWRIRLYIGVGLTRLGGKRNGQSTKWRNFKPHEAMKGRNIMTDDLYSTHMVRPSASCVVLWWRDFWRSVFGPFFLNLVARYPLNLLYQTGLHLVWNVLFCIPFSCGIERGNLYLGNLSTW